MTTGIRNCNPLNIRRVAGTRWKGEVLHPDGGPFVQFQSMEWGIRAAFCILSTYARKHHIHCVRDIIRRWAPPSENDTRRYVSNVCAWTGFAPLQRLTQCEWPQLVRAMARQESGIVLDDSVIGRAFALYNAFNPNRSLEFMSE